MLLLLFAGCGGQIRDHCWQKCNGEADMDHCCLHEVIGWQHPKGALHCHPVLATCQLCIFLLAHNLLLRLQIGFAVAVAAEAFAPAKGLFGRFSNQDLELFGALALGLISCSASLAAMSTRKLGVKLQEAVFTSMTAIARSQGAITNGPVVDDAGGPRTADRHPMSDAVCKADAWPQPCVMQRLTSALSLCTVHHAEGYTMCLPVLWLLDMAADSPAQLH